MNNEKICRVSTTLVCGGKESCGSPFLGAASCLGPPAQGPGYFALSNVGGKSYTPWFLCSLCPGRSHGPDVRADVAEVYPLPSRMPATSACGGKGAEPRVGRVFCPGIWGAEPQGATQHREYQATPLCPPHCCSFSACCTPKAPILWAYDRSGNLQGLQNVSGAFSHHLDGKDLAASHQSADRNITFYTWGVLLFVCPRYGQTENCLNT